MKQKEKCHHCKIPVYTENEQKTYAWLNQEIDAGNTNFYSLLTRLAITVAVEDGRFRRETCDKCQGN